MPSAWLLEEDEAIVTAVQILQLQAEEAKKQTQQMRSRKR